MPDHPHTPRPHTPRPHTPRPHIPRRRLALLAAALAAPRTARAGEEAPARLAAIEAGIGARLGVFAQDTGTGRTWSHRADERFPMCSTFKLLACAALLARTEAGTESLGRRVRFARADLVPHSPLTRHRADGEGMTLAELAAAAMAESDNTAGNLVLAALGGPSAVTAFARTLGDPATRLDRVETALNEATPGDPRDTTTPRAMAGNLRRLLLGGALAEPSRAQLTAWLLASRTGAAKLRAGLPADWRIGDRTGGGDHGTTNDVAVIWPPGRAPLVAAVYLTECAASFEDRNAAIAAVARGLASSLEG